jgi:hypothetical protein
LQLFEIQIFKEVFVFMPNNMNQPNKGQGMQDRNDQGEFTKDKERNASNTGSQSGYGKDTGRQGGSSQSSEHMSDIGKKGGQD